MYQKDQELVWPHKLEESQMLLYTTPCNVIDIPAISEYRTKAKLTFLSSILTSKDPMITEISELLLDQGFTRSQRIPSEVNQVLALAKNSIS